MHKADCHNSYWANVVMIRSKRMNLARRIARMGRKDKTFDGKHE
jgi:hypothetical protein